MELSTFQQANQRALHKHISWGRVEGVEEEVGEAVAAEAVGAQGQAKMGATLAKSTKSGRRQVIHSTQLIFRADCGAHQPYARKHWFAAF